MITREQHDLEYANTWIRRTEKRLARAQRRALRIQQRSRMSSHLIEKRSLVKEVAEKVQLRHQLAIERWRQSSQT